MLNLSSYETRAECRALSLLGADTVGMSTVPEVIAARHSKIRVLAMSLVTNMAAMDKIPRGDDPELQQSSKDELNGVMSKNKANHEEVLEESRLASDRIRVCCQPIFPVQLLTRLQQLIIKIIETEMSK